jgi:predicted  nucleic acid-binding Zn-ribbon protein
MKMKVEFFVDSLEDALFLQEAVAILERNITDRGDPRKKLVALKEEIATANEAIEKLDREYEEKKRRKEGFAIGIDRLECELQKLADTENALKKGLARKQAAAMARKGT